MTFIAARSQERNSSPCAGSGHDPLILLLCLSPGSLSLCPTKRFLRPDKKCGGAGVRGQWLLHGPGRDGECHTSHITERKYPRGCGTWHNQWSQSWHEQIGRHNEWMKGWAAAIWADITHCTHVHTHGGLRGLWDTRGIASCELICIMRDAGSGPGSGVHISQ